jgi:hypothetical protein
VWTAERRVVIVHPDGRRVPGHIAIGQPYTLGGGDPAADFESHCPIEIDRLCSRSHPIISGGTLGALLSGVELLGAFLHGFIADGGRVLDPDDDSELRLDALFGPPWRAIDVPDDPDWLPSSERDPSISSHAGSRAATQR